MLMPTLSVTALGLLGGAVPAATRFGYDGTRP
jgi:hypothetical protein